MKMNPLLCMGEMGKSRIISGPLLKAGDGANLLMGQTVLGVPEAPIVCGYMDMRLVSARIWNVTDLPISSAVLDA